MQPANAPGFAAAPRKGAGDWLRARAALSAVLLFLIGIFAHRELPHLPPLWILASGMLLVAAHQLARFARIASCLLAGAVVFAGTGAAQIEAFAFPNNEIGQFTRDEPRLAWVEAQFSESPRLIADTGPRPLPPRQMGVARVVAVKTWNGWTIGSGEAMVSIAGDQPRIQAGQTVRLFGMLERPAPAMNPGQFDWREYDRRLRLLASINVNRVWNVVTVDGTSGSRFSIASLLQKVRSGVREWLALGFAPDRQMDRATLDALLLGDREPSLRDVENDFQKTGTSHLLASSGVRTGMLAACLYCVCRLLLVAPRRRMILITAAVVAWACLIVPSPQALRPVFVAIALAGALLLGRSVNAVQLLALAAGTILVARPLEAYGAGFQLSFTIVLALLLLTGPILRRLEHFENPDEVALEKLRRLTRWQRARRWMRRRLVQWCVISTIAWIASLPLVAFHFMQFTPWAVPISVALSPVVLAALVLGFLKIVLSMLLPGGAGAWALMAGAPVALLRHAIAMCARLPGADIAVAQPPIWLIIAFYILLFASFVPVKRVAIRRLAWCGPVGACALMLLMPWMLGASRRGAGGPLHVTLLSVGAGQCAAVETAGGMFFIDAGSTTLRDPLHSAIEPFLRSEGRSSIDFVYLSHGDYDHISAVREGWLECGIREVITSPFFREHALESVPCRRLLKELDSSGHSPRQIVAGESFDWGGGVRAQVLWPPAACDMNSNNAGVVLRVVYAGRSILFPADIQDPAMEALLIHPERLKSDVLIAPHHGSSEPLTARFIAAVSPKVILSSNASRLTKKQRDFEQIVGPIPLYRTSGCGALSVSIDHSGTIVLTPFLSGRKGKMVIGGASK